MVKISNNNPKTNRDPQESWNPESRKQKRGQDSNFELQHNDAEYTTPNRFSKTRFGKSQNGSKPRSLLQKGIKSKNSREIKGTFEDATKSQKERKAEL